MIHRIKTLIKSFVNEPNVIERYERKIFAAEQVKRQLPPPTKNEQELIDELRNSVRALPLEEVAGEPAERKWRKFKLELRNKILTSDPREFLSWEVVKNNMVYRASLRDFNEIRKNEGWQKYKQALPEKGIPNSNPYFCMPESSENSIRQVFHIMTFKSTTGIEIENLDMIVDFGGGYGNMCKLIHKLGFKGKYVIFDWPEFSLLQNFYLKSSGITAHISKIAGSGNGIYLINSLEELQKLTSNKKPSLLIATWSLSETPATFREQFFNSIPCDNYLITYQKQFGGVSNKGYFDILKTKLNNLVWFDFPMKYIRTEKNRYLIGKKK